MAFLDQQAGPKSLIIGNSELGFHFGFFNNVIDDSTLGYYSGKRPDFIVVDANGYGEAFKGYSSQDPGLDRFVRKTLKEDFQRIYTGAVYTIYRRRWTNRLKSPGSPQKTSLISSGVGRAGGA